jgi:hypothetical protein
MLDVEARSGVAQAAPVAVERPAGCPEMVL